ncbi:MAG: hypothetical protein FWF59_11725 [Turicibacter sp.]|nr:hypothetical protein [Turicibacter sp.]
MQHTASFKQSALEMIEHYRWERAKKNLEYKNEPIDLSRAFLVFQLLEKRSHGFPMASPVIKY